MNRNEITQLYYPNKVTKEQFIKIIIENTNNFSENLDNLGVEISKATKDI